MQTAEQIDHHDDGEDACFSLTKPLTKVGVMVMIMATIHKPFLRPDTSCKGPEIIKIIFKPYISWL